MTVVVTSNVAQLVVGRFGVKPTLTAGLLASTVSVAALTRLPVDGHYFWDLFPWFVLGGAGMGFSFVPVTIASLTGSSALMRVSLRDWSTRAASSAARLASPR